MRIDIIGGGALGLLYGGKLAVAGNDVRIWCRSEKQSLQLNQQGLYIQSATEVDDQHLNAPRLQVDTLSRFVETWKLSPGNWVFLMTKQRDVKEACTSSLAQLSQESLHETYGILCFQNGAGHIPVIHSILPEWRVYSVVTTEGAKRLASNVVFHTGHGQTWIGESSKQNDTNRNGTLSDHECEQRLNLEFQKAGFACVMSNDIEDNIYRKLLINAVINPLTALWRIPNGELLASAARIELMKALFIEGTAVYDAYGIRWNSDLWDQILDVCRATAANTSSMLKDVLEGTPTEISWINGRIVTMAEEMGVQATTHKLIMKLVEGMR
ncbi:2-dehydropantoate 2-reductase [Paenibacillus sp. DS2015]|uniref:ketopantoate reductase family protein n=1 Tax=Paenibacillus sp. DS2015 TaxID=3373917 RepID=UPI003D21914A